MSTAMRRKSVFLLLLLVAVLAFPVREALALITGGVGNAPQRDPRWPQGAAVIFNCSSRVAYWEGPPFGGGQSHAECRGDVKALNDVLADFAKLDVKSKKIVVHNGVGRSFWLNPNNEPGKRDAAQIDWTFMIWQTNSWNQLRKMPADFNPTDAKNADDGPPSQIDIYTGGNIRWEDVVVPKGLKIDDQRLEAHGFTAADGVVLVGNVTDLASGKPIAAKMRLQKIEPEKKGGYRYADSAETTADAGGNWTLKKAPAGWFRVIVEADGYVPCVAGHVKIDEQPKWLPYNCGLARPAVVKGRVIDEAGRPLADVEVRFVNLETVTGGSYGSLEKDPVKTAADGRFQAEVPVGKATIWLAKNGYCRPGLGQNITTPKTDIELTMVKTAHLTVTVDFTGVDRPAGYVVHMNPESGSKIGSYGGSGNINANREITFENVPPGRYILHGRPNPGSDNQQTERFTVDLKGGLKINVTLQAK